MAGTSSEEIPEGIDTVFSLPPYSLRWVAEYGNSEYDWLGLKNMNFVVDGLVY